MLKKRVSTAMVFIMAVSLLVLAGCGQSDDISEYKSAAKKEIETYALNEYPENDMDLVTTIVEQGKTALAFATTRLQVDASVNVVKAAIDAVFANELEEYKAIAEVDIEIYAEPERYIPPDFALVIDVIKNCRAAVNEATTMSQVKTALTAAKVAIDKVPKNDSGRLFSEIEATDMIELHTWHFTSGIMPNAIVLNHTDETAIFECTVDYGRLFSYSGPKTKSLISKPGETIYWISGDAVTEHFAYTAETSYVEIVLKINNNIIGYAVIKVYLPSKETAFHSATLLKSALFPKVNGEYQEVTEAYVKMAMAVEKLKNK